MTDYLYMNAEQSATKARTNVVIYLRQVFKEKTGMELTKNNALLNMRHKEKMIRHIASSYIRFDWTLEEKSKNE